MIALTVASPSLDVKVEPRLGRAPFLLLVDPETLAWESLENPGRDASGGAGVRVAQALSDRGIRDVVSGEFGPKAFEALRAAGITMHRLVSGTTAREAIGMLKAGELPEITDSPRGRGRGRRRW